MTPLLSKAEVDALLTDVERVGGSAGDAAAALRRVVAVDLIGRTGTHAGRNGHGAPTSHGRSVWLFQQSSGLPHARNPSQ